MPRIRRRAHERKSVFLRELSRFLRDSTRTLWWHGPGPRFLAVKRRGEHEALLRDNQTGEIKRAVLNRPSKKETNQQTPITERPAKGKPKAA